MTYNSSLKTNSRGSVLTEMLSRKGGWLAVYALREEEEEEVLCLCGGAGVTIASEENKQKTK